MAGYRNRLVHFYDEITPGKLYGILTVHLDDVQGLLDAPRAWLASRQELVDESL